MVGHYMEKYIEYTLCQELLGVEYTDEDRKGQNTKITWLKIHCKYMKLDDNSTEEE